MNASRTPFPKQLLDALTIHSLAELIVTGVVLAGGALLHRVATLPPSHGGSCGLMRVLEELESAIQNGMTDENQKRALILRVNEHEGHVLGDPRLVELLASAQAPGVVELPPSGSMLARLERANRKLGSIFSGDALVRLAVALESSG